MVDGFPLRTSVRGCAWGEGVAAGLGPRVLAVSGGWEGYRESRKCSRETYPESYITKYTSIRKFHSFSARCLHSSIPLDLCIPL